MTYIEFRRDVAVNWLDHNPVLAAGEPGLEIDTQRLKLGDGRTTWSQLPYLVLDDAELVGAPQAYVQSTAPINTPHGSVWLVSVADSTPFSEPPTRPGTGQWAKNSTGTLMASEG